MADLKVQVTFTGFPEEDELISRMKAVKVFVLPSTREGFRITTLEAMACGLPVITVKAPRNFAQDLVEDEVTGRIVAVDATCLWDTVVALLSADGRRKQMAESYRITTEMFDWGRIVQELENTYRR